MVNTLQDLFFFLFFFDWGKFSINSFEKNEISRIPLIFIILRKNLGPDVICPTCQS